MIAPRWADTLAQLAFVVVHVQQELSDDETSCLPRGFLTEPLGCSSRADEVVILICIGEGAHEDTLLLCN